MSRSLFIIALAGALLFSACSEPGDLDFPDYTVTSRSIYEVSAGGAGKKGFYVTLALRGFEVETLVSEECFKTKLGTILPEVCR